MVTTRKKRQSNRMLLSQLDDFNHDIFSGNTMSDRQENATVNEGPLDQDFTVGKSDSNPAVNIIHRDFVESENFGKIF